VSPKRIADICFFIGFAGLMYAVLVGTWKPDRPEFKLTVLALIAGVALVSGSFVYMYREKRRTGKGTEKE